MEAVSSINKAKFSIGDLVHHRLFNYRGVIVDVDYKFQSSDEWYEAMAKSRPPKHKPWYHVLVDTAEHSTYVAEQNLEHDKSGELVSHPLIDRFFSKFDNGHYIPTDRVN